jgi:sugar-specific transcriptional regulator TrmB
MGLVSGMGDKPKRYVPLSPGSLIEHFENSHQDSIEELKHGLEQMELNEEAFDFWHIHGYKNLILKLKEMINTANEKLFISAWKREIDALDTELNAAEERGLDLTVFSFCTLDKEYGKSISYDMDENELREIWSPKVIMVADQNITIMGSARDQDNSKAILTRNDAITEIATNHIILDITLAGQRLGFDPNPIVKRIMKHPDLHLDRLIKF